MQEMQKFYFTFGSDEKFPYPNQYLVVQAPTYHKALCGFREKHPDRTENTLNCAFVYTQDEWDQVSMQMKNSDPAEIIVADYAEVITTEEELEQYIYQEYRKYDVELNSSFFDVMVSMKKSEIIKAYAKIQRVINGDRVCRILEGSVAPALIPEGAFEDIYTGNCMEFLLSCNDTDQEACFCRYVGNTKQDFIL